MSDKQKTVLMRFVRTTVATLAGVLAGWLAGPEAAELVDNDQAQMVITMVVIPGLVALDKMWRYGNDPGEFVE